MHSLLKQSIMRFACISGFVDEAKDKNNKERNITAGERTGRALLKSGFCRAGGRTATDHEAAVGAGVK